MGDNKTQPNAQAGQSSETSGVAGEVGVPHSSVDLLAAHRAASPAGESPAMVTDDEPSSDNRPGPLG